MKKKLVKFNQPTNCTRFHNFRISEKVRKGKPKETQKKRERESSKKKCHSHKSFN